MAAKDTPQPTWQPITRLSKIAHHIDGMLESAEENYRNLQEARPKPHVLEDYTVGQVISVFTTQRNDLWLIDEQLRLWKARQLTARQRAEVRRLVGQMKRLR